MFVLLAIFFQGLNAAYWLFLLEPGLKAEAESNFRALAHSHSQNLSRVLDHIGGVRRDRVINEIDRILLLTDPNTDRPFIIGIRLEVDNDVVKAADGELNLERGNIRHDESLDTEMPLYSSNTRELMGIAEFHGSTAFFRKLKEDMMNRFFIMSVMAMLILGAAWLIVAALLKPLTALTDSLLLWNVAKPHRIPELTGIVSEEILRIKAVLDDQFVNMVNHTVALQKSRDKLAREIEERKQAERELQNAQGQREAANAANKAKSDFLANMSHELRTPLNAVLGYAQILKRDKTLTEQQNKAILTIHRSGDHLLTMIDDILDLSKIEARKAELEPTGFHLRDFFDGVVEIINVRAEKKGITFTRDLDPGLPVWVQGDETRLRQILLNLLGNAVKFTDRGSVTLLARVDLRKADGNSTVTGPPSPAPVRFEVRDTGPGIPPDHLEEIFRPFEQVKEQRDHAGGTGLGLPISRSLVRMMGGELRVESTVGRGSSFWFRIGLSEVEGIVEIEKKTSRQIIGFQGEAPKILIADDLEDNRSVLKDMLSPLGFEIREAIGGEDAVAQAADFLPDVILMDIVMPGMDGLEAVQKIREFTAETSFRPFITAVSASMDESTREKSREAGCDIFLHKPIREDRLLELLRIHAGIEWFYEDAPDSGPPPETESMPMIPPPMEELDALRDAAKLGAITDIKHCLEHIKGLGREYHPFASAVQGIAAGYRLDEIIEFIQSCSMGEKQ